MTKAERRAQIAAELVRLLTGERKRRRLSMNEIAYKTGLSQSTISRLENNRDHPTFDSLLRVADELEVNLGDLTKRAIRNVDRQAATPRKAVDGQ